MGKRFLKDVVKERKSSLKLSQVNDNGYFPVFGASGIVGYRDDFQIGDPAVAIIKDGAGIGRVSLLPKKSSVLGTMEAFVPNSDISNEYLYFYLTHLKLGQSFTGSTIPHIYFKNYKNSVFPDESFDNQMKKASYLISISNEISKKKNQIDNLDFLVKSLFNEMFGDPEANSKNFEVGKINDIGKCVAGATPSTSVKEYWENGTIPWLSSGEVNKGHIYETDSFITQLGYDNASTKLVPAHTVVLAMAGQGKTRGTPAIAEIELCTNQSICSIVNNEKVNAEYLYHYLLTQYGNLRSSSNGDGGRGGLNLKIIGNFRIIIPPIELQNEFADFVKLIDKSKFVVQKEIKDLQELLDSKMDEYFGGDEE